MITIKTKYPGSKRACQIYHYPKVTDTLLLTAVIRCNTINSTSLYLDAWIEVDGKRIDDDFYTRLINAIEHNAGPRAIDARLAELKESLE